MKLISFCGSRLHRVNGDQYNVAKAEITLEAEKKEITGKDKDDTLADLKAEWRKAQNNFALEHNAEVPYKEKPKTHDSVTSKPGIWITKIPEDWKPAEQEELK